MYTTEVGRRQNHKVFWKMWRNANCSADTCTTVDQSGIDSNTALLLHACLNVRRSSGI